MYVKLSKQKWTSLKNLTMLFFTAILSLLGFSAAILTLLIAANIIPNPDK